MIEVEEIIQWRCTKCKVGGILANFSDAPEKCPSCEYNKEFIPKLLGENSD